MKRLLSIGLLAFAVALRAPGQPSPFFVNPGTLDSPPSPAPVVYATNFENDGTLNIVLGSTTAAFGTTVIETVAQAPFDFSDVLNFTNKGTMTCDVGYRFDTAPSASHGESFPRHMSANFLNGDRGLVSVGSVTNIVLVAGGTVLFSAPALPLLKISSTNIFNTGQLNVGENGLLSITGNNAHLEGGSLTLEGQGVASLFADGGNCIPTGVRNPGIFDNYWGGGRGTNIGANFSLGAGGLFGGPTTPLHKITLASTGGSGLLTTILSFSVPNAQGIANDVLVNGDPSNHVYQAVFFGDSGHSVSVSARFQQCLGPNDYAVPVIQWLGVTTNAYTGLPITNTLYLSDFFGGSTNTGTTTNASLTGSLIATQSPVDYEYDLSFPGYNNLFTGLTVDPNQLVSGIGATNSYIAYGVNVLSVTAIPDPTVPSSTFSNSAGRIEITANQYLNLNGASVSGPNYINLTATNHFAGSQGAQFIVPVTDLNLGLTNGALAITGLVAPNIPRITDTQGSSLLSNVSGGLADVGVFAWSCQWTNVDAFGVTNRYHVLMVSSALSPDSLPLVENLTLQSRTNGADTNFSGNVTIADLLNVNSNLLITAKSLTIVSNAPGAPNPFGELNWLTPSVPYLWSANFPSLRNLTNSGVLSTLNTAIFEQRTTPYFPSPTDGPYLSFVNHGTIATSANEIWANYFENTASGILISSNVFLTNIFFISNNVVVSTNFLVTNIVSETATITSSGGVLDVQANTALVQNSLFSAGTDMSLDAGTMTMSNLVLDAGGALDLAVTNQFNFTTNGSGRVWTNTISVGDGFSLLALPATGDLMGSTITSTTTGSPSSSIWAGQDLGNNPAGFTNNMALGHVIFDSTGGHFHFTPAGVSNALYIDFIDLRDAAANEVNPNFPNFTIDPGMTIYFGGASNSLTDISEKLNGANGGRFQWVSNFNDGIFSSLLLTNFPSGTVYRFNRALRNSCDIDSNGDGIVNCEQAFPFFVSESLVVSVKLTNQPPSMKALVSWTAPPNSINYLYARTNLTSTNWVLLTNFVQTVSGPVTVADKVRPTGSSLYRVIVHLQP